MKLIYAPGTTVTYNEKAERSFAAYAGGETIICEVSLSSGYIQYATLEGAWLPHQWLDWVSDPTKESLQEVFDTIDDGNDSEEIDEDEEIDDEEEDEEGNEATERN